MRLSTRIALLVSSAVAVAIVAASIAALVAARSQARGIVEDRLREQSSVLRRFTDALPPPGRFNRVPSVGGNVFAQVIDGDGVPVVVAVDVELPVSEQDVAVATRQRKDNWQDVTVDGVSLRVLTVPVGREGAVMLAQPLTDAEESVRRLRNVLVVVAVIGVAGAGGVGYLVARRAMGPVRQLSDAAVTVAHTRDLDHRLHIDRRDELGELASSFNEMLEALEVSRRQQHRLVTDASHELRTPLTSLRTNMELMARRGDLSVGQRQEIMDDVLFELDELTALVSELVELATDVHDVGEPETVDLAEIVRAVVERFRRRTDAEIELTASPSRIHVVAALAERAVANLVDNAVKFGDGQPVTVTTASGEVHVRDRGPGIAPEDREAVFERFYRTDEARARPGSGLGLSIVQQVAERFGGTARVEDSGVGAHLVVSWPTVDD